MEVSGTERLAAKGVLMAEWVAGSAKGQLVLEKLRALDIGSVHDRHGAYAGRRKEIA